MSKDHIPVAVAIRGLTLSEKRQNKESVKDFISLNQVVAEKTLMKNVHTPVVFKYANLILWKEKYILGRIGLYFGGFGKKLNLFKGFGEQRQNTFMEVNNFFRDFGRSMHYF